MTGIGRLRERVVLEAPVESDDGAGGVVRTYATQATLWAEIIAVSAKGALVADAAGASVTHRITIRSGVDVTMRHRFRLGARIFEIVSMRDADPQGRLMLIEARERVD
ncbi:MAG: phage head closure protein [Rhizobiales bacterium]|nr:phage head closure protein [Hyphomicrobiales bacterium]